MSLLSLDHWCGSRSARPTLETFWSCLGLPGLFHCALDPSQTPPFVGWFYLIQWLCLTFCRKWQGKANISREWKWKFISQHPGPALPLCYTNPAGFALFKPPRFAPLWFCTYFNKSIWGLWVVGSCSTCVKPGRFAFRENSFRLDSPQSFILQEKEHRAAAIGLF